VSQVARLSAHSVCSAGPSFLRMAQRRAVVMLVPALVPLLGLLPAACHGFRASADENATSGYPTCPKGGGCLQCPFREWRGYSLTPGQDENHYVFATKQGQKVPVVLPTQGYHGEGGSKNCFAYATHQLYQTPGESTALVAKYGGHSPVLRPHDVTWENFQEAMRREEAIFIGRTTLEMKNLKDLPVVEGRSYYIVAAFLTPNEEYHFWGLWNNGWYCVSSKISAVAMDMGYFTKPEKQCPTGSMWMQMKNKNPKYSDKIGGFYLFPCRGDEC